MAVVNYKAQAISKGVTLVTWASLAAGDTGQPYSLIESVRLDVQGRGVFATASAVIMQGANQAGQSVNNPTPTTASWASLWAQETSGGSNIVLSQTAAFMYSLSQNPAQIRPFTTADGGATQSLTVELKVTSTKV